MMIRFKRYGRISSSFLFFVAATALSFVLAALLLVVDFVCFEALEELEGCLVFVVESELVPMMMVVALVHLYGFHLLSLQAYIHCIIHRGILFITFIII